MKSPANTVFALLMGTTLLVAAVPALAQSAESNPPGPMAEAPDDSDDGWGWRHGKGRHHGMGEGRHGGHHRGMMIIDANADGLIGADEASALAERGFMHMDQNRDDVIDKAEFVSPHGPGRGPDSGGWRGWFGGSSEEAAAVQKVREDKFATLDTDKDGKLTKTEFFADVQQKLAAADTDKDGKVTPWEFRAMPRP